MKSRCNTFPVPPGTLHLPSSYSRLLIYFISTIMTQDASLPMFDPHVYQFDARGVSKRFRHAAIFGALSALQPGETMRFCNDHDPLPLLAQIEAHFGNQVAIAYVAREPGQIVIDFQIQA